MGDKQLRRFRVYCQSDLRNDHHGQLFKRVIREFKLKARALIHSHMLDIGVTFVFPNFK